MHRRTLPFALVVGCLIAGGVGSVEAVAASRVTRDAHIAGQVSVCNTPDHCLTREFKVHAIDSAGRTVAGTDTTGSHNAYRLRVAPGHYRLVARSSGLVCRASADAVANQTTRRNIICLVP